MISAMILASTVLSSLSTAQAQELTPVPVGGDVVPMVGTSSWALGEDLRAVSVNLGVGYAGAVDGVELGLGVNVDRLYMRGLQAAGGVNVVGGDTDGVQLAGGVNVVGARADGVQASGGANIVGGDLSGVQLTGGANVVGMGADGLQISGGGNIAGAGVDGAQISGGVNVAGGVVDGAQISAGANVAGGVDGAQVAPVNVAVGHVDGVQVGVLNIARTSDFSLGLVNIIWEGRTHVDAWASEDGFAYTALKHGGARFHYIYGVGYRPALSTAELPYAWSAVVGLGGHTPLGNRLFADMDILAQHVNDDAAWTLGLNTRGTARLVGGVQLVDRLALIAGPTYNVQASSVCGPRYAGPGAVTLGDGEVHVQGWPGWIVGVELL